MSQKVGWDRIAMVVFEQLRGARLKHCGLPIK
jgi:hypothetical protein